MTEPNEVDEDGTAPEPVPALNILESLAEQVDWSDTDAEMAARARLAGRAVPSGGLGRLEELVAWMAATQGACPPREPERVRLVVFAAEHGIAEAGVSADPAGTTALRLAALDAGTAVGAILAGVVGAGVRLVDLGVPTDGAGVLGSAGTRRRVSGRIDRTDAMSEDETLAAIEVGVRIADEEIDAGADLLIAGDVGVANTTVAAALVAVMTNTEPVKVVGRGSGIDDDAWCRKVAAIRDARRRGMPERNDMLGLLRTIGGPDVAAMTGFLLRAAGRRTPVILDGVLVGAAALIAREVTPRVIRWWLAGHRTTEPGHAVTLEQLPMDPLLDLQLAVGEGAGALLAVPLMRAAARLLTDLEERPVGAGADSADEVVETDSAADLDGSGSPVAAPPGSPDVGFDERGLDQPGG